MPTRAAASLTSATVHQHWSPCSPPEGGSRPPAPSGRGGPDICPCPRSLHRHLVMETHRSYMQAVISLLCSWRSGSSDTFCIMSDMEQDMNWSSLDRKNQCVPWPEAVSHLSFALKSPAVTNSFCPERQENKYVKQLNTANASLITVQC